MQSADFSECCTCCGDRHIFNKCSACKMVRYCNARCQKLHWSAHKNFCKLLREQYEEKVRIEKLEKEHEERMKLEQQEEQKNNGLENSGGSENTDGLDEKIEQLKLKENNSDAVAST